MLNLQDVTLLCVETRDPNLAHWAIDQCLAKASFAKVVLLTDLARLGDKKPGIEYVQAPPIKTTKDYSHLLLTGIGQFVSGTHVLIIQWDSFITHPELWDERFLKYDYIGPVWPHHSETPVGNGGFSLRSLKLLKVLLDDQVVKRHPEDYCICVDNKGYLEQKHNIKFAPALVAEQFAVERSIWHPAFGFHGFFNFGRVLNDEQLQTFINLLPVSYFSGLDSYDLIAQLKEQGRYKIAKAIGKKIGFKWKMRKRYLKLKIWLYYNYEL